MGRIDDKDRMKLEPDRPRLDVAHARQQQRREHVAIGQTLAHAHGDFLNDPIARRLLEQTNQRLYIGMKPDDFRIECRLRSAD